MKVAFFTSPVLLLTVCCGAPASRPAAAVTQLSAPDPSRFQPIKPPFYRNKAGRLFEQREWARESALSTWYDSTVVVPGANEATTALLSDVIDLASYQELGNSLFSKDKSHVYYSYSNSGGGFRTVVSEANPATFRAAPDYQYGFDDKHGFYCDRQLPGLNVRRRQLLYDSTGHFITYVKDDQHVFYEGRPIAGADARTFHQVRNRHWEAEDRNHRYQCCGQRLK